MRQRPSGSAAAGFFWGKKVQMPREFRLRGSVVGGMRCVVCFQRSPTSWRVQASFRPRALA